MEDKFVLDLAREMFKAFQLKLGKDDIWQDLSVLERGAWIEAAYHAKEIVERFVEEENESVERLDGLQ